ncbi:PssE/Cps14G family polysaccharide biosynthesis glycosyltransferase [Actinoallomurus vinaceus]|uniref:PssE/Cps14G family polysaccharide biosynthesis glycosyltransferase n=1 Tax=Actinoallomurus vinaceus TaxID=1080074 RepID=A0ABP8UHD0_9ACTN
MSGPDKPLVFVTVGTDHHRFDRLMDWMERWLAANGHARCVVQHGPADPPVGAEGHAFLPHADMQALFLEAAVVVCQGGPGSITESRQAGSLPIVVPRIARLDEVVDDHQVRFSRHVATFGKVALAETAESLHAHLDRALAEPGAYAVSGEADETAPAVARFGRLVDELVAAPRGRRRRDRSR